VTSNQSRGFFLGVADTTVASYFSRSTTVPGDFKLAAKLMHSGNTRRLHCVIRLLEDN